MTSIHYNEPEMCLQSDQGAGWTNKQTNKQKKGKKEKKKRKGVLIKCKMNNITIK